MIFPKFLYKPATSPCGFEAVLVRSEAEVKALGKAYESPADFGIITCPCPSESEKDPAFTECVAKVAKKKVKA